MAEYFERGRLLDFADRIEADCGGSKRVLDMDGLRYLARTIPAADVAPVVRCKDCKHYRVTDCGNMCKCWVDWIPTEDDDFCSYGERRDTT